MNMAGKKFALCGYPPLAEQVKNELEKIGAECNLFVGDFLSGRGQTFSPPLQPCGSTSSDNLLKKKKLTV